MTRTVVVTGASAGVGRAVAHAYADRGARLALPARGERALPPPSGSAGCGALRHMRAHGRGTIVQVGSALAYRGIPLQSAYCASKHAVRPPGGTISTIPATRTRIGARRAFSTTGRATARPRSGWAPTNRPWPVSRSPLRD